MAEIGSIRAYAKHRKLNNLIGASDTAVRKAITAKRINKRPDGKLDFVECDVLWAKNTDPTMHGLKVDKTHQQQGANPGANPKQSANLKQNTDSEKQLQEYTEDSINALKRRELELKVENLEIEAAKKRGELVSKDNAVRIFQTLARQDRDSWLNWVGQISSEMAADLKVDQHEMQTTLTRYVKMNLVRITEMKIDDTPATKL